MTQHGGSCTSSIKEFLLNTLLMPQVSKAELYAAIRRAHRGGMTMGGDRAQGLGVISHSGLAGKR